MIRSDTGACVPVRHKLIDDTLNQAHDKIARLEISVQHWRERHSAEAAKHQVTLRQLAELQNRRWTVLGRMLRLVRI